MCETERCDNQGYINDNIDGILCKKCLAKYKDDNKFICVFQDGWWERDRDGRYVQNLREGEVKRFPSRGKMTDWIRGQRLDEITDPRGSGSNAFELVYAGKEEECFNIETIGGLEW